MGNFIPKPYSTEQVSIRVDTELLARVEAAANKYNMSRNAFINESGPQIWENRAAPAEAPPKKKRAAGADTRCGASHMKKK